MDTTSTPFDTTSTPFDIKEAELRWCRVCGRYVQKPMYEHEVDPRYAKYHAGPVEWGMRPALRNAS